ncbi:hypothetical protein [Burkholderia sp. Ac-20349]|uniref:beta strand repeat-containing protein n=1 Tax=Burkholderia sp. Ac-20349 TaxID=2703893 RepID=UPI00197BFBEB|nr:hypothetical protein [Burkholderia sp. Ac-20349]MBN3839263.1 hypothetical protein [Burkholderia sp. Ac-20349]
MANIVETVNYDSGVYLIGTSDAVVGGAGGIANLAATNLANRTAYLKSQTDTINATLPTLAPKLSPALTGTPTTAAPNVGDNSTQISTTAFVQITSKGRYALNVAGNSNVWLSATQAGYAYIEIVGALTGNIGLFVPASASLWTMKNSTTGPYTVTILSTATGGAQLVLPQGSSQEVITDGQNVYSLGYVPLTGGTMQGPLSVMYATGSTSAQLNLLPTSDSLGRESKLRMWGTFGSSSDTGARLVASLRAGFNGGTWGTEYLDFYINSQANDAVSDANTANVMRLTYGGRMLLGVGAPDDGVTTAQILSSMSVSKNGAPNQKLAMVAAGGNNNFTSYSYANSAVPLVFNSTTDGSNTAVSGGSIGFAFQLLGVNKLQIPGTGNVLLGGTTDDGSNMLQVPGSVRASNYLINGQFAGDAGSVGFNNTNGPAISFYGSSTAGAGSLIFRTATVERARVSAAGRLLIGTTTDNNTDLLQVNGSARLGNALSIYYPNNDTTASISTTAWSGGTVIESFNGANTTKKVIAMAPYGGRVLIGTTSDDGSSLLQVAGNTYFYGVSYFGQTSSKAYINCDANQYYLYGQGNAYIGSVGASGYIGLVSGNAEHMRVTASGRILIGTVSDNGADLLQVAGSVRGTNGVGALIASNGSGSGQTSMLFKREGAATDQKTWEVMHDSNGAYVVRTVNDAYSSAYAALQIARGSGATLGAMSLMPTGGRVLINSSSDDGINSLQVQGNAKVSGTILSAGSTANGTTVGNASAGDVFVANQSGAHACYVGNLSSGGWYSYYNYNGSAAGTVTPNNIGSTVGLSMVAVGPLVLGGGNNQQITVNTAGRILMGTTGDDGSSLLQVNGIATASTPANGDSSNKLVTSSFVQNRVYGRLLNVQVFTASGTYTPTPGTTRAVIEMVGGGGGGAAGPATTGNSSYYGTGSGGSSGAYAAVNYPNPVSQSVTIGAGGAGGTSQSTSSASYGVAGGSTSFGSICTCPGGPGGTSGGPSVVPFTPAGTGIASAPSGTGIFLQSRGNPGTLALADSAPGVIGGGGGAGPWGGAGNYVAIGVSGAAASAPGAGGGGSSNSPNAVGAPGGAGAAGIVVVYEYGAAATTS